MKKTFALLVPFALSAIGSATAQDRIDQVLVFPGGATVERLVPVKAGAQQLRVACLPARFDADSLQIRPEPGVTLGEISIQTVDRAAVPECANSPLDARIRELQDQIAGVAAESDAQGVALDVLRRVVPPAGQLPGTLDTVRKNGLDALAKQHQLARRREDLEKQLAPLTTERDRLVAANPQVRTVAVRMAATKDAELHLSYRLSQAGWEPVYRAYLDTATGAVRLERHAQVAQSSGEDWTGVKLRLSTAQPRQATGMTPPYPWTLDILPPAQAMSFARAVPAPVMAKGAMAAEARDAAPAGPSFDLSVFEGEFATEYEVPGRATVAATGERIAYALGSVPLDARVMARSNPQAEPAAYLVAESARPAGVWPAGALQLYRDGTFVGQSRLSLANLDKLDLYFGRDDMVRVTVDPEARNAATTGFIGTRAEQKIAHVYKVENLHRTPFAVQVLEASPVAQHEDIKVTSSFEPKPTVTEWRKEPGINAWEFILQPGASQSLKANYLISYPKDARLGGMR